MENEQHNLTPNEKSLLNLLKEHGLSFSSPEGGQDIRDTFSREIKEYFSRLTSDGLSKLFDTLHQKGHILKDNQGWFKLVSQKDYTDIAIVGSITAGHLQEAIQDELGFVRFAGKLSNVHQLYAFQVDGDSMIGDDIYDGDCVLLRNVEVQDGQIGAVIVNGETTLKRIYRDSGFLRLVPSNPMYDTIHIPVSESDSFKILGRLEAVINHSDGDVRWFSSRQSITEINLFLN
ncbi:MAG: LexA family protein [Rhodothermales bacterium]